MTEDQLIIIDGNDLQIGTCGKMETHQKGLLHRAFSIFLFHEDKLLIQRRALHKYHCGGLWANTCCSHPRNGEELEEAFARRLLEETGIDASKCNLKEVGTFIYRVDFENGLTEHELDHVVIGEYGGDFEMNPDEVCDMKYVPLSCLEEDMEEDSTKYAYWFIKALPIAVAAREKEGEY